MSLRQTYAAGKHSFNKLFCLIDKRIDPESEETMGGEQVQSSFDLDVEARISRNINIIRGGTC